MKRLSLFVLVFVMLFSYSSIISAEDLLDSPEGYYDESIGGTVIAAYELDENGNLVEISLEEYQQKVEAPTENSLDSILFNPSIRQSLNSNLISPLTNYVYYHFAESNSTSGFLSPHQVSEIVTCSSSASTTCTISISRTANPSRVFSDNVTADDQRTAIHEGLYYSYSKLSTKLDPATFTIYSGTKGYVVFKPKATIHTGSLSLFSVSGSGSHLISTKTVTASYPVRVGNTSYADGLFAVVMY